MRRSNTQTLSEVLREYIKGTKIDIKLKETNLVQSWETLLGKTIARYTKKVSFRNGILYVEIPSAVVKNELIMMREEIRRKMNENAGEELVQKIVFR